MMQQLLRGLLKLEHPPGWQVRFLIVDNDAGASARSIVEGFTARFGEGRLAYVVEPRPGIPAARNRALREATQRDARLLAFIDDDEYPDPDWLRELVAHFEATGAALIGGPVRLLPPAYATGTWRRLLARSLIAHSAFLQAWSGRRARQGRLLVIATNNWLGDLHWIACNGVRFDEAVGDSGGSDTVFFAAVQRLGGKVAWCERARVNDHLAPDRLSLRYQLKRFRSYGITAARTGRGSSPDQLMRMFAGLGLMIVPVLGWASLMLGVHMVGTGIGWFAGLRGARSHLYAREPAAGPGNSA